MAKDFLKKLKIKIYSDGADKASLFEMNEDSFISGMTTNPSLMKKAGVKDYPGYCKEILARITQKPISFEVFADDLNEMKCQADIINSWGKNVYVKIPVTNSEGVPTYDLIKTLTKEGVKLNVTAIFTIEQTRKTCDALKGGAPSIVSVFAGRIADVAVDPEPLLKNCRSICDEAGKQAELLWASTREPFNILQAERSGCHIITVPPEMIKKCELFGKSLESYSLDTVKMFKKDAESSGFSL